MTFPWDLEIKWMRFSSSANHWAVNQLWLKFSRYSQYCWNSFERYICCQNKPIQNKQTDLIKIYFDEVALHCFEEYNLMGCSQHFLLNYQSMNHIWKILAMYLSRIFVFRWYYILYNEWINHYGSAKFFHKMTA